MLIKKKSNTDEMPSKIQTRGQGDNSENNGRCDMSEIQNKKTRASEVCEFVA